MHYFLITAIIGIIVLVQLRMFSSTVAKFKVFKGVFSQHKDQFELIKDEENSVTIVSKNKQNVILQDILDSINRYLEKNRGTVSDFHLIKDIVDRNCDTIEEEANTQIPMPLYLGLVGTMLGILIGIGFLVFTGGLSELLSSSSESTDTQGITELFGGIALAMIASIVGITLTTVGSHLAKGAKKESEKGKNNFLSWIQAELLPELSGDQAAALNRMVQGLTKFNKTFSGNTTELRETLAGVNESYQKQAEFIQSINQLKIRSIATANIEVYEKLKNCTNEIGVFAQFLQDSNKHLQGIQSLNAKLDEYENRTQIIETIGKFFMQQERWVADSIDKANLKAEDSVERFNKTMCESLDKLRETLDKQILYFNESVEKQQKSLYESISAEREKFEEQFAEKNAIVEEIKNLADVKLSMSSMEEETRKQNQKIDALTSAIKQLAAKDTVEVPDIHVNTAMPRWVKVAGLTTSVLLSAACISFLIVLATGWTTK